MTGLTGLFVPNALYDFSITVASVANTTFWIILGAWQRLLYCRKLYTRRGYNSCVYAAPAHTNWASFQRHLSF